MSQAIVAVGIRYGRQNFRWRSFQIPTCENPVNLVSKLVWAFRKGFKILGLASKVKKAAHSHIAKLMSWSMQHAGEGKWPTKGFCDEEFSPKSLRGSNSGQELAGGWRP